MTEDSLLELFIISLCTNKILFVTVSYIKNDQNTRSICPVFPKTSFVNYEISTTTKAQQLSISTYKYFSNLIPFLFFLLFLLLLYCCCCSLSSFTFSMDFFCIILRPHKYLTPQITKYSLYLPLTDLNSNKHTRARTCTHARTRGNTQNKTK